MHCTYMGSRAHIADLVATLEPHESTAVVDTVTLNREGLEEQLRAGWDDGIERAVLIRPATLDTRTAAAAADYLSWLDHVEERVAAALPTTVLELPRSPRDWETDVRQALGYGVLCLVDPGGGMSLVSRSEQQGSVISAVQEDTVDHSPPRSAAASDVVGRLAEAAHDSVECEVLAGEEMRTVLADAGLSATAARRIVDAQHLAVSGPPDRRGDDGAALDDVTRMARTILESEGKE